MSHSPQTAYFPLLTKLKPSVCMLNIPNNMRDNVMHFIIVWFWMKNCNKSNWSRFHLQMESDQSRSNTFLSLCETRKLSYYEDFIYFGRSCDSLDKKVIVILWISSICWRGRSQQNHKYLIMVKQHFWILRNALINSTLIIIQLNFTLH